VAQFLRDSFVYDGIRGRIAGSAGVEAAFREYMPMPGIGGGIQERNAINALPVPQPLRELLYEYNTPDVRGILRVGTLEDFVAGFLANIVINVISVLVVFILVLLILHLIGKALHIVDKLPVISSLNRLGGVMVGAAIGAGVVWLGMVVVMMFISAGGGAVYDLVQGSAVTGWMLDNGWLLPRLTTVT